MVDTVEGTIMQVMESWPLQLVVETPFGRLDVLLSDDAKIIQSGRLVEPNVLSPGKQVSLRGQTTPEHPRAFLALEVHIISSS